MRKKHRFFPLLLLFVLILGLSGMGVTYARWNHRLGIRSRTTTGILDFVFHKEQAFTVSLVDENGQQLEHWDEMETILRSNGKTAEITLQFPFTGTYLTEQDSCFIRMECPISLGEQGTVDTIELSPLDLTGESYEKAVFTPVSVTLQTDSGEYELPENVKSEYSHPLLFDVYRGVEETGGYPAAIICLSLQDNSRELLLNLPTELELSEEDVAEAENMLYGSSVELVNDTDIELSGESPAALTDDSADLFANEISGNGSLEMDAAIIITYHCTLPVYAEQGRKDIMHMPKGVDDNE